MAVYNISGAFYVFFTLFSFLKTFSTTKCLFLISSYSSCLYYAFFIVSHDGGRIFLPSIICNASKKYFTFHSLQLGDDNLFLYRLFEYFCLFLTGRNIGYENNFRASQIDQYYSSKIWNFSRNSSFISETGKRNFTTLTYVC